MPIPSIDWDSSRSIPFTVVDWPRSLTMMTRFSISSAERPGYWKTAITTGMSMAGKMSTVMREKARAPITTMTMQSTTTV